MHYLEIVNYIVNEVMVYLEIVNYITNEVMGYLQIVNYMLKQSPKCSTLPKIKKNKK